MALKPSILNIETLGEAMRPENLRGEAFRLSREERDHVAGHALDSIEGDADKLSLLANGGAIDDPRPSEASTCARKVAALSNLLGDIGWQREDKGEWGGGFLGELFPVAQLRPWLEEWQREDSEALTNAEEALEARQAALSGSGPRCEVEEDGRLRQAIANAQTELGTGAILLARIEKWVASHEN